MEARRNPVRHQESSSVTNFRRSGCQPISSIAQRKPTPNSGCSQTSQKSFNSAIPTNSEQSRPLAHPIPLPKEPSVNAMQPEKSSCKFGHSFLSQSEQNKGSVHKQAAHQNKVQVEKCNPTYPRNISDDMCHQFGLHVSSGIEQTTFWELPEDPDYSHWRHEALEPVQRQSSLFSRDIWSVEEQLLLLSNIHGSNRLCSFLSYPRLRSHSGSTWSQKLSHERRQRGCSMCLL